jgi:hypothetical protein
MKHHKTTMLALAHKVDHQAELTKRVCAGFDPYKAFERREEFNQLTANIRQAMNELEQLISVKSEEVEKAYRIMKDKL